jgi:3-phenylpropionate/trans-cinnamate dioxygenase ferredoxin subunit
MFNYKLFDPDKVEYLTVAEVGELADGERKLLEIDGEPMALFRIAGEYFAIADVCSHDDGPVAEGELRGYEVECPRHGARFDVRDGRVLSLPAAVDIPAYPVRVVGDEIQIGLPLPEAG